MFYIDDYVDLSSGERRELREKIENLKKDHFVHYLPKVVEHFDDWIEAINGEKLDSKKAQDIISRSQLLFLPVKEQIAKEAVQLLGAMDKDQQKKLVSELEERVENRYKRSDKEIRKKVEKRFESNMERFFGSIEPQQEKLIAKYKEITFKEQKDLGLCQTEALNQFKEKLSSENKNDVNAFIQAYFLRPETINSENCNNANAEREKRWAETLSELHPLLTLEQKKHFQKRIQDWQEDLREIYKKEILLTKR